ncbi:MAG: cell division protein ZapA [Phenylobacterium sp.]|nr:cell division protein ZapA [Phenylobacterium sp.]
MAQVTLDVNGRPYVVGCEDGQEQHLTELAELFDRHVRQVGRDLGQLGETRLFLMGALLLADELTEIKARLSAVQADLGRLQSDHARVETRAVAALDSAARRIEKLAGGDKAA